MHWCHWWCTYIVHDVHWHHGLHMHQQLCQAKLRISTNPSLTHTCPFFCIPTWVVKVHGISKFDKSGHFDYYLLASSQFYCLTASHLFVQNFPQLSQLYIKVCKLLTQTSFSWPITNNFSGAHSWVLNWLSAANRVQQSSQLLSAMWCI